MKAAAVVPVAMVLGLVMLGRTVHAQSNMCYPSKPKANLPMKKGGCFLVTHTFPAFFGLDVVRLFKCRSPQSYGCGRSALLKLVLCPQNVGNLLTSCPFLYTASSDQPRIQQRGLGRPAH
jgi:hypothetical protein